MAPSDPLKIYPSGLRMESSETPSLPELPPQVFAINIDDIALEDMIRCAQTGQEITLSLGKQPTFFYEDTSYSIPKAPADIYPHEIFFTKPLDDNKLACRVPIYTNLHTKPPKSTRKKRITASALASAEQNSKKTSRASTGSNKSHLDTSLEQLQSSMARHEANRGNTLVLNGAPPTELSSARNRNLLRAAENTASQPASPNGSIRSGSPAPESGALAKSVLERNKQQRIMVVHELAVKDRTTEYLRGKWTHKIEDFDHVLKKAAEFDTSSKTWSLAKNYWKELDVWAYDYECDSDRQIAINNAISRYDRMRLSANQVEWERLLPEDERGKGKGKTLSKIQANLDRPMGGKMVGDDKGEMMVRTKSNPLPKATSKKSEKEKRLITTPATVTKKTAATRVPKAKSAVSSTVSTPPTSAPSNRKFPLSAEIVTDTSDNESSHGSVAASSDERLGAKMRKLSPADSLIKSSLRDSPSKSKNNTLSSRPIAPAKLNASPSKTLTAKTATSKAISGTTKSTTTKTAVKRSRDEEEEDDSSSSSTPLIKRHQTKAPYQSANKPRITEPVRMTPSSSSNGTTKKVPSPMVRVTPVSPSSISDRSDTAGRLRPSEKLTVSKKRSLKSDKEVSKLIRETKSALKDTKATKAKISTKQEENDTEHKAKRPKVSFEDVVNKAARFKLSYQKYHLLHDQISKMAHPPAAEINRLVGLRKHLQDMKQNIYNEHLLCQQ